jgi:hypothetical protein
MWKFEEWHFRNHLRATPYGYHVTIDDRVVFDVAKVLIGDLI